MSTSFITNESSEAYHAKSKSGEFLSSHKLADFRECPLMYHKKMIGEIIEEDTPAFALGRATHTLILEGLDIFNTQYVVADGPINPKTGEVYGKTSKAYQDWMSIQTGPVITSSDFDIINKMRKSVKGHEAAAKLLADGKSEVTVRAEYCGMPCQIRMDWFNPELGICDLKTCAEIKFFESDARKYGYIYQLAFYRAILREHMKLNSDIHLIAIEKDEPFVCGVWRITDEALDYAEHTNMAAIERLKECKRTGIWPTNYENMRYLDFNSNK